MISWRNRCSYASACSSSATSRSISGRAALSTGSIEVGNVLRQILDVVVRQCTRDARHVAGVVGAALRLEVRELLLHVSVLLTGNARNLVLPDEIAEVTHRAQHLVRLLLAGGYLRGVGLEAIRRLLLL